MIFGGSKGGLAWMVIPPELFVIWSGIESTFGFSSLEIGLFLACVIILILSLDFSLV